MEGAISMLLPGQSSKQTNQLDLILGKEDIRKTSLTAKMSCCERSKCSVLHALLSGTSLLRGPAALVSFWHGRFGTPNSFPFGFSRLIPSSALTLLDWQHLLVKQGGAFPSKAQLPGYFGVALNLAGTKGSRVYK
jgi:hypothetical protein